MKVTKYIEASGCLFVSRIEFDLIERDLDPEVRAEYAQTGYPRITLEDESSYLYIPVTINGVGYRLIPANRPEHGTINNK